MFWHTYLSYELRMYVSSLPQPAPQLLMSSLFRVEVEVDTVR